MLMKNTILDAISVNGKIITKRCTESYFRKIDLYQQLIDNTPSDFETVSDKIKYHLYGGGYCDVCGIRTNLSVSGRGFARFCAEHFHTPKKGKPAHNTKNVDTNFVVELYNQGKSFLEIAETIGNISNVTVAKILKKTGMPIRSHAENQKLQAPRGYKKPVIMIDREQLVEKYNEKIPIKALAEEYNCHPETIRRFLKEEGVEMWHRRSYIEWIICDLLKQNDIVYTTNDRTLIAPLEIDIYIPSIKVGIEINGMYTHSMVSGGKTKYYHHDKFKAAEAAGIRLIQLWEDDITNKFDIIESMILNICNLSRHHIGARQCELKSITNKELNQFCEENHIQGRTCSRSIGVGLFHQNTLVSVIGYYGDGNGDTIITRFCTQKNMNISGAFSKMLVALPGSMIKTFSANDISIGNLYKSTGFVCTNERRYELFYTDYKKIYNRQRFMKNKLKNVLAIYDETKTEIENMLNNGFDVIYKSGMRTWVLNREEIHKMT